MTRTALMIAATLALAPTLLAQRPEPANAVPVIVVTGEAQIRVVPDEATVRLGITRQTATAQAVQDQANTVANEILAAVTKLGIAASDIQTSRLTLTPVYAPRSPEASQAPRIVAYQASNIVSVRVTDLAKVGPVIDTGLKAGANEVQGVGFGLRDDTAARQQALKQAVAEARKKAETIAAAANVTLGIPLEIAEQGVSLMKSEFNTGVMMARAAADMAPTPVSPGQLEVRANVTIRYRIGN
jgi:uncharacterized protein